MKNFLKYLAFIFATICLGVLMIFGVGKIYSSFDPWPKEKKEAYQFYLLKREIISNPEVLSKISVVTQNLSTTWTYDTITPYEVKKLYAYPQPDRISIKIPYKKWDAKYNERITKECFKKPWGKSAESDCYPNLYACLNFSEVFAGPVFKFNRYAQYEVKRNEDIDPILTLKEMRKVLKRI